MFDYYDTLITPEEVADMLGCGMNTTYKLLKSGKIKAMRLLSGSKITSDIFKTVFCTLKWPENGWF